MAARPTCESERVRWLFEKTDAFPLKDTAAAAASNAGAPPIPTADDHPRYHPAAEDGQERAGSVPGEAASRRVHNRAEEMIDLCLL